MAAVRKKYDPLHFIPSVEVVREKLEETLELADRLKILLEVAERIRPHDAKPSAVTSAEGTRAA